MPKSPGLNSTFPQPEEDWRVQRPKRCDKHGDKNEDNNPKNVNNVQSFILFDPYIGSYQVLQPRTRVELGAMPMNGVLRIPQSSSITGTSPSDCLESYHDTRCGGGDIISLQRYSWCILLPQPTGQGTNGKQQMFTSLLFKEQSYTERI